MIFKNMPEEETFTLRNQENELTEFGPEEIKEYLEDLFVTPDQFVVLSAPKVQGQKIHPETAGYQRGADLKKLVQEQQCRQKPETAFSLSLPPGPITASQQKTQEKAGPQPG